MYVKKTLKSSYLSVISSKGRRTFTQNLFFGFCVALSFIYTFIVTVRNFLYDKKILPVYCPKKSKVISIGNINWAGSGKTSLALFLYNKLEGKKAIVTKGYAPDEYLLLKEKAKEVFDAKNRVALIKKLCKRYSLFILDDGFQYRKLGRDLDIVLINSQQDFPPRFLLPASAYREYPKALKRADIVVLTYAHEKAGKLKEMVKIINPKITIFTANYKLKNITDLDGKSYNKEYFCKSNLAALCAIGYPEGFFSLLKREGLTLKKKIVYPDHSFLNSQQIMRLESQLLRQGINNVLITAKDYYHIDFKQARANYFIVHAGLEIDKEEEFLNRINAVLNH